MTSLAALRIFLTLLEESAEGFEVVDDSDGYLGTYLDDLGAKLAEVILSLNLEDERRGNLLSDLDEIRGKLSNYGVEGLEVAIAAEQQGRSKPRSFWRCVCEQGRICAMR